MKCIKYKQNQSRSHKMRIVTVALLIVAAQAASVKEGRTVGGSNVGIAKKPWHVGLIVNERLFCSGSILTPNYILTAARCVEDYSIDEVDEISVRSGSVNWDKGGKLTKVSFIQFHPEYNIITHEYNIAILTLVEPLEMTKTQQAVTLKSASVDRSAPVQISGWGDLGSFRMYDHLKQANMTLETNVICNKQWNQVNMNVYDSMICATGGKGDIFEPAPSICKTDEGGALTQDGQQVAVNYFGLGCFFPGNDQYDAFTRVDVAKAFIDRVTENEAIWA